MPVLNFKSQFASLVESGQKTCTIRAKRKRPVKSGDRLYLYTGQRTKKCRKLGESVCLTAEPISIYTNHLELDGRIVGLFDREYEEISTADGFSSIKEFRDFFLHSGNRAFHGDRITWGGMINDKNKD